MSPEMMSSLFVLMWLCWLGARALHLQCKPTAVQCLSPDTFIICAIAHSDMFVPMPPVYRCPFRSKCNDDRRSPCVCEDPEDCTYQFETTKQIVTTPPAPAANQEAMPSDTEPVGEGFTSAYTCPGRGSFPGPACNRFWWCSPHGGQMRARLMRCVLKLMYHPEKKRCVHYSHVKCQHQPIWT